MSNLQGQGHWQSFKLYLKLNKSAKGKENVPTKSIHTHHRIEEKSKSLTRKTGGFPGRDSPWKKYAIVGVMPWNLATQNQSIPPKKGGGETAG